MSAGEADAARASSARTADPDATAVRGPSPAGGVATAATNPQRPPGPERKKERMQPPIRVGRVPRRARLVVRYFDPWTVLKLTFVVSLVVLIIAVVAVSIVYAVLAQMGVWDSLNGLVQDAAGQTSGILHRPFTAVHIIGLTAIVGGVNVILFTALGTLASFVYNLVSETVGGVEVTLSEPE